jgi:cytochrome c peroxidase
MIAWLLTLGLVIPLGLDLYMPVPAENPITAEGIVLGRRLFHDRRLSRDRSISCASCHNPNHAFSDGRPVAVGVFRRAGRRSAPALVNRAYGRAFFWDGRTTTLEEQVLRPIEDPAEMDLSLAEASARVAMPVADISRALATYVRSILSGNAPYDRFLSGDTRALTADQRAGLQLFRGRANCTSCHIGPTFTDERFHNTGVAWVEPPAGSGRTATFADEGRFLVTRLPQDRGAFKTPTLREVAATAPYMHDGSLASLEQVIDFYDRGGRANPHRDPELRPLRLLPAERRQLIAFLRSLSGTITR